MLIEQALYGEAHGGHSLLATSGNDQVPSEIVQQLDLPDTAPPGVHWSPFLRGFPCHDRYVLARTFLDTCAPRGGMVFSHALILPLDQVTRIPDLRPILAFLTTDDVSRPPMKTIDLPGATTVPPDAIDLLDAAEALASTKKFPVIRAGSAGFDDLIVALWGRLLPELRRRFAFRLSFGPHDLVEQFTPDLVCTPQSTVGSWTDYRVIGAGANHEPNSLASAMLSGRGNPEPLLAFMREIEGEPTTFTELQLFDRAYQLTKQEATLERCVSAVRLVAKLSPDPRAGRDRKDLLITKLQECVYEASAEQILLMRNLQLSAYPSPARVWTALETWISENTYPRNQDRQLLSALKDATCDDAVPEWRAALLAGLATAARACKAQFRDAFWRWIQTCPEIVDAALRVVMAEGHIEKCVAEAAPSNITPDIAKPLLGLARSRGWFRIHGTLLSVTSSPLDAVRQQITIDTDFSFVDGVRLSLRMAEPEQVLSCALELDDPRTILLAGREAAKRPELLTEVDFRGTAAQAVWQKALAINQHSWQAPASPEAALYVVLDCLLEGEDTNSSLIAQLSSTPLADLGRYCHRAEIWQHFEHETLSDFLAATSKEWLKRASQGHVPFLPEARLQSAILEGDALDTALGALVPRSLRAAIGIVSALDRFCERRFQYFVDDVLANTPSLSVPAAKQIGRLILDRQWATTADGIVEQYRLGRQDLKHALRAFRDMLDFWTQWQLGLSRPTKDRKWEAFEELASELYPTGPRGQAIWERAGGDDADLVLSENGRTQWHEALRNARRGKGVRPSEILRVMKTDFPNNERVSRLCGDPLFEESKK